MELKINIPEYSGDGLRSEWEDGSEIEVKSDRGSIVILANKAGLVSLAKQLLTLAQDHVPSGFHFHFDDYNSLVDGSTELIIEKR
jgi:hypothetical protein